MILEGLPHERGLWLGVGFCGALLVGGIAFTVVIVGRTGSWWNAVAPAACALIAVGMLAVLVESSLRRERLVLDRQARSMTHKTWTPLLKRGRERRYTFERVAGVAVEQSLKQPGNGGFPRLVTRACLLLALPRTAIELDEVQNAPTEAVRKVATEVADFLGVRVVALGGARGEPGEAPGVAPEDEV